MMVLIFSPDLCLVTLAVIIWFIYFIRWMVLWLAGSESFDWLLPRRTSLSIYPAYRHLSLSVSLSGAHTQQLPTGRQRCYCCTSAPFFPIPVHCGIVAGVVIATVMQWPPSWNRFHFYLLGGRSRSDIPEEKGGLIFFFFFFKRKGVSPLVWRNQCQQCVHTAHVSCIGVVPRSSGAAAH